MNKLKQKRLLTELMEADEKDGLYGVDVVKEAKVLMQKLSKLSHIQRKVTKDADMQHSLYWAERCDRYVRNIVLQYTEKICRGQRNRDKAVYSINRTKTSTEIRDAILKAPLLTDSPAICRNEKQNLTDKQ